MQILHPSHTLDVEVELASPDVNKIVYLHIHLSSNSCSTLFALTLW